MILPQLPACSRNCFAQADRGDPAAFERADVALKRLGHPPDQRQRAELMRDVYMPISPDALVVADDLDIAPQALAPYLDYVRKPGSGYVSVELPLGDRIELSLHA